MPVPILAYALAFAAGFLFTLSVVRGVGPAGEMIRRLATSQVLASIRAAVARDLNRAGRGATDSAEGWLEPALTNGAVGASGAAAVAVLAGMPWLALPTLIVAALAAAAVAGAGIPAAALKALHGSAERRVRRIVRLLPYSVELIVLIAEAGGSLEEGLLAVTGSMPSEPITHEFERVLSEQRLGRPFLEALRAFAARIDNKETSQLVTSIEIGRELGTPLATSLSSFAEWIRTKRVLDGERLAREAAPKMALPNTMIMAANVLLILAPFLPALISGNVL